MNPLGHRRCLYIESSLDQCFHEGQPSNVLRSQGMLQKPVQAVVQLFVKTRQQGLVAAVAYMVANKTHAPVPVVT